MGTFLLAIAAVGIEPPLIGRPPDFSGAVGRFEPPTMMLQPREVTLGQPVTLTLRFHTTDADAVPPRRPDMKAMQDLFHVRAPDSDQPDRTGDDGKTWEFDYELWPRAEGEIALPPYRFHYYDPVRRRFQTRLAVDPGSLRVLPKPPPTEPLDADERFFKLDEGPAILPPSRDRLPLWFLVTLALLVPPLGCLAWYLVWRRLYPDAARRARIRRSRAARRALHALRRAGPAQAPAIMADYLRQRLDLTTAEPTPDEVAETLRRAGVDEAMTEKMAAFFRACDATRFGPGGNGAELPGQASDLILTLEQSLTPPRSAGGLRWRLAYQPDAPARARIGR